MIPKIRSIRHSLLIGASLSSLVIVGAHAQNAGVFRGRGGSDPAAAAARAAQAQAQRSAQTNSASQRAVQAFRRAADTRAAMSAAQRAARTAAQAAQSNVPNGLSAGGLQVANGVATDPSLWQGAKGPVESQGEGGRTNVTIDQTQQKAILTWDSFNVGRETDLKFNQGGADWVALNRVTDASADPTRILGSIKAAGSVYIINRNGVIFGGASQVNVRNLIASTANITNDQFLNRGIYSQLVAGNYTPVFTRAGGAVTVEAGAQITTNTPTSVTAGGGFVLLMGTEVTNAGSVTTPKGQTLLSAGDDFIVRRGFGTAENPYSTTRGNEVRGLIDAGSRSGTVTNAGQIEAAQGDITLAGRTIRQDGVALATTSVNQRGTIHLLNSASDALGSVTLGKDSLTAILPELDSKDTALNGQHDTLIAQSNEANAQRLITVAGGFDDRSLLADRLDQSRVEIVTGGNVMFAGGSQTMAQGGQVAVQANAGRITVADGARIDVSGVMGVALDMEKNSMLINIQGNEMRDSPANRDAEKIRGENVWVDVRDLVLLPSGTGGYEGDRWYTPGGLLEVGGHLGNMAHGIGEWAAVGGTITLSAKEVVAEKGSIFDISGGSLDYRAGWVRSTRVMGADGRMYDIRNAPAHIQMIAVGNAFVRKHARWGEQYTEVYSNPLFSRGTTMRWEDGYSVGRDAGRLILSAPTVVMEGNILAEVINGDRQTQARADGVTDGYKLGQHTVARAGVLSIGKYDSTGRADLFNSDVIIGNVAPLGEEAPAIADADAVNPLPAERTNTVWLDAGHLSKQGLGGLEIGTRGTIALTGDLTLADGGRLDLTGPNVTIAADVTARSGAIAVSNIFTPSGANPVRQALVIDGKAEITVADDVQLDLRGGWSNGYGQDRIAGLGLINGGSVSLRSTQDVSIGAGARIDVSSGGAVLVDGSFRGGRGGDVTLQAGVELTTRGTGGALTLDGTILGHGAQGGGKLSLQSYMTRIGGPAAAEGDTILVLGSGVFASGFSQYEIAGTKTMTVAEGATVDVTMPVYHLREGALGIATGSDPAAAMELWTPPLYLEDPQGGRMTQRAGASLTLRNSELALAIDDVADITLSIGKGAVINVDAGQRIALTGPGDIEVNGRLNAWGGAVDITQSGFNLLQLTSREGAGQPPHGRSIWIGETAVLDVAARAATAVDAQGRDYGLVRDGGTITLGGRIDEADAMPGGGSLFVVVREGAVLDASGTQAKLDIGGRRDVAVASSGGTIAIGSVQGLYLLGDMKAAAGGAGAAGGTLELSLGTTLVDRANPIDRYAKPRELIVTNDRVEQDGFGTLTPQEAAAGLVYGHAALSVAQVKEGGFGNLGVAVNGQVSFAGDVDLSLSQGVRLYTRSLALAESADADSRIRITAPYLRLAGIRDIGSDIPTLVQVAVGGTSTRPTSATLTLNAGLIDLRDNINFGANGTLPSSTGIITYDRRDFDTVTLNSSGDIRMMKSVATNVTRLTTAHDLVMSAAQVYPTTHAQSTITADTVRIARSTDVLPAQPYSVFGELNIYADVIDQGGVVRAPLGILRLGRDSTPVTTQVNLLAGSITSVSANGLVMPYGGTVDGIRYDYDGTSLAEGQLGQRAVRANVELSGQTINAEKGSVIDVSGGGSLTGAGFISGRGGSVDVLRHTLAEAGPGYPSSLGTSSVYALVPSFTGGYAPVAADAGAGDPLVGQQITLDGSVPGLPAGTYTLMPSTYALQKGAFRIEIAATADTRAPVVTPLTLTDGSHLMMGRLGIAGTDIREAMNRQVIVTPAATVRKYSLYNEMDYSGFLLADAARRGIPRGALPSDAQRLTLNFANNQTDRQSLIFAGVLRNAPGKDGWGGEVVITPGSSSIEIVKAGSGPTAHMRELNGITLEDAAINAIGASRLMIGGQMGSATGESDSFFSFTDTVAVRSGAMLTASDIFLINGKQAGSIIVEQGAVLNTLGKGSSGRDSRDGFVYKPLQTAVFAVSNSYLTVLTGSDGGSGSGPGSISIGTCATTCSGTTKLYSEGTIVAATDKAFTLSEDVLYGTRNLTLAVGGVNVGTDAALAAAREGGILPAGLALNQTVLDRLLRGDTSTGAPALETLVLNARDSVNFFGTATLDTFDPATGKSRIANLVITSGGLYGHGNAGDVATIRTANFIWNGTTGPSPAVMTGGAGTGSGSLNIDAQRIEFGFGPQAITKTDVHDRLALGFATVNLNASERVTANHKGTLSVYQSQGAYVPGTGYSYSGGNLNITAPFITVGAGASNSITAGGAVQLSGSGTAASVSDLGGTLSIRGETLTLDTAIVLPSGKLTLAAKGDLILADGARLDLAGREVPFDDVKKYSWGGEVTLESKAGNIRQDAPSVIDLSARNNNAGRLNAIALGADAGLIDLQGRILGATTGQYDAGGSIVPYTGGLIDLRAQRLGDFAALNTRLNTGEMFGGRAFQIKQGDLTIGSEVKARDVTVSLDGGALTVNGRIDASGVQVGSIRLYAANGLTLTGSAVLDAHGTGLRVDSYGKIIDSPNRAIVELGSGKGTLSLATGAQIDLRSGTGIPIGTAAGQNDGKPRGTLALYAPRLGADDVAIDAGGTYSILGARLISVNATRSYGDADLNVGTNQTAGGRPYHTIDQTWLDQRHAENTAFIDAALGNTNLMGGKLAGLNNASYRDAFHLRPTVEVASSGDLVVTGDLDLSGYRYNGVNPNTPLTNVYGSGEVGTLVLRAGGDLSVFGSINDGFAPPPEDMPEAGGWVLLPGEQMFNTPVVVPRGGIGLHAGTRFRAGDTLNYDVPLQAMTVTSGTRLPVAAALTGTVTVPANTILSADIRNADGSIAYAAGTRLLQATTLEAGMVLGAGTVLTGPTALAGMLWPKGVPLPHQGLPINDSNPDIVRLDGMITLPIGGLIPAGAWLELGAGVEKVELRSDGGKSWALAQMLPEGSQSWSLRLVAGADLGAADNRRADPNAAYGKLLLADTHYGMTGRQSSGGGGLVLNDTGSRDLFGSTDYAGLTLSELDAKVLAEFGLTFQELAGMSLEEYCSFGEYCETKVPAGGLTLNETGSQDLFGNTDYAGLNLAALDKKLMAEYGLTFQEFIGLPFEELCGYGDYCRDVPSDGPASYEYTPANATLSVLRTGTGDLDLVSAGDLSVKSLYGIYTAGTSTISLADSTAAGLNAPRGTIRDTTILNGQGHQQYVDGGEQNLYRAWYPDGGGNLSLNVGGNLTGDLVGRKRSSAGVGGTQFASSDIGNWLWRQTSVQGVGRPTAWWINFGTYASTETVTGTVGFTGFGTLGGGNVAVRVAGDAGTITRQGDPGFDTATRSEGLVLAVGSTGRVVGGQLIQTGGGDLDLRIGGGLNPAVAAPAGRSDLGGAIVNLRGTVQLDAGSMGSVTPSFAANLGVSDTKDTRANDPFVATAASSAGGLIFAPGDATLRLNTRADLVVRSVIDSGRIQQRDLGAYAFNGVSATGGASSWFTLWTDRTAVDLFAAGGNMAPLTALSDVSFTTDPSSFTDVEPTDGRYIYPSILRATAAGGNIYTGLSGLQNGFINPAYSLLLAPGARGQLEMLAGNSIYAGGFAITPSGADLSTLVTPFNPGMSFYNGRSQEGVGLSLTRTATEGVYALFGFGHDTVTGRAPGAEGPARFYARDGDIVGLRTGEMLDYAVQGIVLYEAARPVWMKAGRDIVSSGTRLGEPTSVPNEMQGPGSGTSTGNLFVHSDATDISIVQAGRDLLYSSFTVAGPGTLEITAGRNLVMEDVSSVTSIGPVIAGDARPGADIAMMAGMANGIDWAAVRARYLDPARLANPAYPLAHPENEGKVAAVYDKELIAWLGERYGFTGTSQQALAAFDALAPEQQRIFLRNVYYAETRAGGREYNDPASPRFASYLRSREMIGTLFPDKDGKGAEISRPGDIILFGGSGVRTNFGGNIDMMAPGGQIVVGVQGNVPPASAGLVTQGAGDIRLFSEGSLLLGLSRILTTFGGDIFAWSEEGDINAGRGAKTTVLYTPPLRTYDLFGNVRLAPQVPSSGAGIGTLNPIPEVPAGDVDLIAPLGTIDAGEAGIRVSGNVNLAALQVLNAANIQVQGTSKGIPQTVVVNTGALTAASTAATAAINQATQLNERTRPAIERYVPTVVFGRFLGFGE